MTNEVIIRQTRAYFVEVQSSLPRVYYENGKFYEVNSITEYRYQDSPSRYKIFSREYNKLHHTAITWLTGYSVTYVNNLKEFFEDPKFKIIESPLMKLVIR